MAENTLLEKLEGIHARYVEVGQLLTEPDIVSDMKNYIKYNKEYRDRQDLSRLSEQHRERQGNPGDGER